MAPVANRPDLRGDYCSARLQAYDRLVPESDDPVSVDHVQRWRRNSERGATDWVLRIADTQILVYLTGSTASKRCMKERAGIVLPARRCRGATARHYFPRLQAHVPTAVRE
jgi:hypothetical protein